MKSLFTKKAKDLIKRSVGAWHEKNITEEAIAKRIDEILSKERDKVILNFMGFSNSFGRLEVDHCNGRSGESAIGKTLSELVKKNCEIWIAEAIKDLPKLSKAAISEIKKDYIDYLKDELKHLSREEIDNELNGYLEDILIGALDEITDKNKG